MQRLAILLSVLAFTGCTDEQGSDFDPGGDPDFKCNPLLDPSGSLVNINEKPPTTNWASRTLTVNVSHPSASCMDVDRDAGVKVNDTVFFNGDICPSKDFVGTIPAEQANTAIHFQNAYGERWMYLGDLFAPRTGTVIGHEDWSLPAGQEIVVAWSPASDLARAIAPQTTATFGDVTLAAVPMPDGVHVTVPAGTTGTAELRVSFTMTGTCGNDSRCAFQVVQRIAHTATITP